MINSETKALYSTRYLQAAAFSLLWVVAFRIPLVDLGRLVLRNEDYNYIALVPAISLTLLFLERRHIFNMPPRYCPAVGVPVILIGLVLSLAGSFLLKESARLSLAIVGVVVVCLGGFVLFSGIDAFRKGSFPLLFLFCIVPPPTSFLNGSIEALQAGSAFASYWIFKLAHVPVLRQGFVLILPGAEVEVARECSGIRSSASLMISGLLAGHIFLQSISRKTLLALCIVPIMILKNAVRIAIISLLGVYVDRSYFAGSFHRQYGGLAVSALAVAVLLPLIWLLKKSEMSEPLAPPIKAIGAES